MRILIAEDHHDAAEVLRIMMERWGHEARVAYDGIRALELADLFLPHVALLDIVLPRMHGYALARKLGLRLPAPRLVAVTAWGQDADRALSRNAGIEHHFLKPVDPQQLQNVLDTVTVLS